MRCLDLFGLSVQMLGGRRIGAEAEEWGSVHCAARWAVRLAHALSIAALPMPASTRDQHRSLLAAWSGSRDGGSGVRTALEKEDAVA